MNAADPVPTIDQKTSSLARELEAALEAAAPFENGCESALEAALAGMDGLFLFQLHPEPEDDRWIGAVLLGSEDDQTMSIVTIAASSGTVSVETLEHSQEPLARIVPAYAAVLAHLRPAA